jgi:hypothetical protein
MSADSLQIDVLNWYKKVYGKDFMEVRHPEHGIAFIKVDGNRRITIFKQDDMHVWAIFTDMLVNHDRAIIPPQQQESPNDTLKVPYR